MTCKTTTLSTLVLATTLVGSILGASGCSTKSFTSMFDSEPKALTIEQRAETTPTYADEFNKIGYRLQWRGFPVMLPQSHINIFELHNDSVTAIDSSGVITVMEGSSGLTRWSDQVASPLTKFVGTVRDKDRLFVSSETELFGFEASNGVLKTRHDLAQVVSTRPILTGDIVMFGCLNGQLLGHHLPTGAKAWGSGLAGSIESDAADLGNSKAAYVSTRGDIAIVDAISGASTARARLSGGGGSGTPSVGFTPDLIIVASTDQSLYGLRRTDLAEMWRYRTESPLIHRPIVAAGKIYCDLGGEGFSCLDTSGKVLWSNKQASGTLLTLSKGKPVIFDGMNIKVLDAANGITADTIPLKGNVIVRASKLVDGDIYVATGMGVVAKYSAR